MRMQSEDINRNDSAKKTLPDKFVTVLEVNESTRNDDDDDDKQRFVTVLQVEDEGEVKGLKSTTLVEEVTIYRLPGERLGMGLKFEGGCHVSDCVTRLFIQSITAQSPASRARCSWGQLEEGDMIMQIQGRDVVNLTRLDCVSILRDAPVALVILVQHESRQTDNRINSTTLPSPPPPVPVRMRTGLRLSPQIARAFKLSREPNGKGNICDGDRRQKRHNNNNNNYNLLFSDSPVAANSYVDLIAEEESLMKEYESDETGSSVSTVIDRLTTNNALCEHERTQSVFDLTQALTPFEQLEEELETEFEFALNGNHCADGNATREKRVSFKEDKSESLFPAEMYKEEKRVDGNNKNITVTQEGFVNREKKKLENLIENSSAAPAPMTTTRVKSRVRKPRAPPPPVPSCRHNPPKIVKKPTISPPSVPPRNKIQRQNATLDNGEEEEEQEEQEAKNDERLQAVQCWLEASLLSNKEVGQGEDMRVSPVSTTRDASDVERAVVLDSPDDSVDAGINSTDPLPQIESTGQRESAREMASEELLIDFSEDFATESSRLPPDGHEFPPVFDDSLDGPGETDEGHDEDKTRRKKESDSSDENIRSTSEAESASRRVSKDSFGIRDDDPPAVSASEMLIELMSFDEETKLKNCEEYYARALMPPLIPPPPVPAIAPLKSPTSARVAESPASVEETKIPELRKPFKSLLRNVDEKNCMSLREKIALFSNVDGETSSVSKRGGNRRNSSSKITNKREESAPDGENDHFEKNDGLTGLEGSENEEMDTVIYRTEWNSSKQHSFGVGSSSQPDGRRNTISDFTKTNYWDKVSAGKNSLYSLLESRRQQVSKLKGLVIPEKQNLNGNGNKTGNALPLITSGTDSIRRNGNRSNDLNKFGSLPRSFDYGSRYADVVTTTEEANEEGTHLSAPPWREGSADFPKYSPAFKRKSLSVMRADRASVVETRPRSVTEISQVFTSFESKKAISVHLTEASLPSKNSVVSNFKDAVESEDKDSIISSSGSNFSTSLSPPISPNANFCLTDDDIVEEYVVIRIEDKASPDDVDSKSAEKGREKVNRTSSVDSLNRRNILEQAKHSRGINAEVEKLEDINSKPNDEVDNKMVENDVLSEEASTAQKKYRHRKSLSDIASASRFDVVGKEINRSNAGKRPFGEKGDGKVKSFRDLAEQWELRSHDSSTSLSRPQQTRRKSLPANAAPGSVVNENVKSQIQQHFRENRSCSVAAVIELNGVKSRVNVAANLPNKNGYVTTPERKEPPKNGLRPQLQSSTSIGDLLKVFEQQSHPNGSGIAIKEKITSEAVITKREPTLRPHHSHMSSQDSTASESDVFSPTHYGSVNSLTSIAHDQYGSITSLASSTSLISTQELQQLLDEANQSLEESGTPLHEIIVVVLHREVAGGSIGITLAGGADYEAKEITVHKIISGSLADRDGRIQKGDRVLSINGKNVKGLTHKEALNILKAPRPECVLVLSRNTACLSDEPNRKSASMSSLTLDPTQPVKARKKANRSIFTVELAKDATGLGFSLEGGKDSPAGDKPLIIKKIFLGGSAEKSGILKIGDEIISVNGVDVTNMARIEAWNLIKKQPSGITNVVVRPV